MSTTATITSCASVTCAFNNEGCTANAITVGGDKAATCLTFITLDVRGPVGPADAHVGACQRLECVHNADLLCTAEGVAITGEATCATYQLA